MSLAAFGTAANIIGVATSIKDVAEIILAVAGTIDKVKRNEESITYWRELLEAHIVKVNSYIEQAAEAPHSNLLTEFRNSLILLKKEIVETNKLSFTAKWRISKEIEKKIEEVEKNLKNCKDFIFMEMLSSITSSLETQRGIQSSMNSSLEIQSKEAILLRVTTSGMDKKLDTVLDMMPSISATLSNIDTRVSGFLVTTHGNTIMERTTMLESFKDYLYIKDYDYLVEATHRLIGVLSSEVLLSFIQGKLSRNHHEFDCVVYYPSRAPVGDPIRDCTRAIGEVIRLLEQLQNQNLDISVTQWFIGLRRLCVALHRVGLRKENLQLNGLLLQLWNSLVSRVRSTPILSHLGSLLRSLAISYLEEGRTEESLSLVEHAIKTFSELGRDFRAHLADCLGIHSACLRKLRRFEDALRSAQACVDIFRSIANVSSILVGIELASSLTEQAEVYLMLSQPQNALECGSEALQWLSKLNRDSQLCPYEYTMAHWSVAKASWKLGDLLTAECRKQQVLEMYSRLMKDRPTYYSRISYKFFSSFLQNPSSSLRSPELFSESSSILSKSPSSSSHCFEMLSFSSRNPSTSLTSPGVAYSIRKRKRKKHRTYPYRCSPSHSFARSTRLSQWPLLRSDDIDILDSSNTLLLKEYIKNLDEAVRILEDTIGTSRSRKILSRSAGITPTTSPERWTSTNLKYTEGKKTTTPSGYWTGTPVPLVLLFNCKSCSRCRYRHSRETQHDPYIPYKMLFKLLEELRKPK